MASDDRSTALEEAWESWLRPVLLILAVLALAGAHLLGWLAPLTTATIVAVAFVLVALVWNTAHSVALARGRGLRAGLLVLGLAATALGVSELWMALSPGSPDASAVFDEPGDTLTLAAVPGGRLIVEAAPLPGVESDGRQVAFTLSLRGSAGHQAKSAHLRLGSDQPAGPRSRGGGAREFMATSFVLAPLGKDVTVSLASMEPPRVVSLAVHVYAHPVPILLVAGLLAAIALGVAALESRLPSRRGTFLTIGVATAATFGFVAQAGIAPSNALMSLLGRLLLSGVVGGVAGSILPWLLRKLARPPASAPV